MANALTDRDRWLALGLLVTVLLLGYLVLVHPWWTQPMLEVNERIHALRERELRVRTQLQQAPAVEKQLAAALALQAQRPGFLGEASTELATAGLVQRLESVVKEASPGNRSCGIANQSPLPQAAGERFARVAVQVRLRCGTPELAAVLHALESGSPRLFVDNLNILSSNYAYMAPEGGTGGLDVTFDLYGYLKPGVIASVSAAAPAAMTIPEGGDAR
ncbi:type II secretion system protein GspM [Pseudoxanthomonas beigongshangi]